jgi:hypothetical protein
MNELFELIHCKRKTELFLRALWGRGFCLQQSENVNENSSLLSYIADNKIFLPAEVTLNQSQENYYRAAATHAAAHKIYSKNVLEVDDLNLMQRSVIGLIEDLRIELLSINEFPGLRRLWLEFHSIQKTSSVSAVNLMMRLSRCILDPDYFDNHHWVIKGKMLIRYNFHRLRDQGLSIDIGLSLANDLGQMRLPLNSGRYEQAVIYRDDNRCLWKKTIESQQQVDLVSDAQTSIVHKNKLEEDSAGKKIEISENDENIGEGFYIRQNDEASFKYNQKQAQETATTLMYPEWDYRSQLFKNDWCTLIEHTKSTDASQTEDKIKLNKIEAIFNSHRNTLNQLRYIAKKFQTQKQQRVRRMQEGDDIDFDPLIKAMVAMRMQQTPDTAVFVRDEYRHSKTLAISILLDLSESTNAMVTGTSLSISQMMRDAVLLLAETLSITDEQFSIAGFSSNGRHEVNVTNFKSFSETFDESKARLADIQGQHSTRLGTAIRHSAQFLAQQPAQKKLLLVVTDGEPSDIDVFDERYLDYDSWQAVNSLVKMGVQPFCLNLDSGADSVIEHIFGKGRYETLEQLTHLPDVLSRIYLKYGRH